MGILSRLFGEKTAEPASTVMDDIEPVVDPQLVLQAQYQGLWSSLACSAHRINSMHMTHIEVILSAPERYLSLLKEFDTAAQSLDSFCESHPEFEGYFEFLHGAPEEVQASCLLGNNTRRFIDDMISFTQKAQSSLDETIHHLENGKYTDVALQDFDPKKIKQVSEGLGAVLDRYDVTQDLLNLLSSVEVKPLNEGLDGVRKAYRAAVVQIRRNAEHYSTSHVDSLQDVNHRLDDIDAILKTYQHLEKAIRGHPKLHGEMKVFTDEQHLHLLALQSMLQGIQDYLSERHNVPSEDSEFVRFRRLLSDAEGKVDFRWKEVNHWQRAEFYSDMEQAQALYETLNGRVAQGNKRDVVQQGHPLSRHVVGFEILGANLLHQLKPVVAKGVTELSDAVVKKYEQLQHILAEDKRVQSLFSSH